MRRKNQIFFFVGNCIIFQKVVNSLYSILLLCVFCHALFFWVFLLAEEYLFLFFWFLLLHLVCYLFQTLGKLALGLKKLYLFLKKKDDKKSPQTKPEKSADQLQISFSQESLMFKLDFLFLWPLSENELTFWDNYWTFFSSVSWSSHSLIR